MSSQEILINMQIVQSWVRIRAPLDDGAVTGYGADRETVIELLNEALATKLIGVLRCRRHHFMTRAIHLQNSAQKFLTHGNEELGHADQLAERIVQLGGAPDFSPEQLVERSHSKYAVGTTLASMIREDLEAKSVSTDNYRSTIQYLGDNDPTTRRMLEDILAVEEKHADDMADLLMALPS